jgi:hypothetical protein
MTPPDKVRGVPNRFNSQHYIQNLIYHFTISVTVHTVKVKTKLLLCLTKHHAMKTYGEVEVNFHAFLTSELEGCE